MGVKAISMLAVALLVFTLLNFDPYIRNPVGLLYTLPPPFSLDTQYQRLINTPGDLPHDKLFNLIRPYHLNKTCSLLFDAKPADLKLTDRSIVALDGREDEQLVLVLRHSIYLLGPEWGLVLFLTESVLPYYVELLGVRPGGWGEHIQITIVSDITKQQANDLPGSVAFYKAIPTPHMLIVQRDGFPLRSTYLPGEGTSSVWSDDWMHRYVYLGAPWNWCNSRWCKYGGNGGVSYRRRDVMIELLQSKKSSIDCSTKRCVESSTYDDGQEDMYISRELFKQRPKYDSVSLLDEKQKAMFAVETIDSEHPFFQHQSWRYLGNERSAQHLAYSLQYYVGGCTPYNPSFEE